MTHSSPEALFKTCVMMKFVDDDDDDVAAIKLHVIEVSR